MAKLNKTQRGIYLAIFLLSIVSIVWGGVVSYSIISGQGSQSFALVSGEAFLPRYWTAECVPRSAPQTIEVSTHTDKPTWYSCTSGSFGTYIPQSPEIQCLFEPYDYSSLSAYRCKMQYDSQGNLIGGKPTDVKDSRCEQLESHWWINNGKSLVVPAGDYVYINTIKLIGDAKLRVIAPSYGLRVRSADGLVNPTTLSCEISSIRNQGLHTIDRNERTIIVPNVPMNAVTGLVKASSTQLVSLPDVRGGEPIYITRPGFYNLVKTAEDGFRYVHTELGEFSAPQIECIPRTTGCSDDAKVVKITEQSCDKFGGVINNYAPVQGDNSKLCKYSCSDGKLQLTKDCIQVPKTCPNDKPLWDTTTGLCTAVKDTPVEDSDDASYLLFGLGLLGGGIVVAGLSRRRAMYGEVKRK